MLPLQGSFNSILNIKIIVYRGDIPQLFYHLTFHFVIQYQLFSWIISLILPRIPNKDEDIFGPLRSGEWGGGKMGDFTLKM